MDDWRILRAWTMWPKIFKGPYWSLNIYSWLSRYIYWLTVFSRIIAGGDYFFFQRRELEKRNQQEYLKSSGGTHLWMRNRQPPLFPSETFDVFRRSCRQNTCKFKTDLSIDGIVHWKPKVAFSSLLALSRFYFDVALSIRRVVFDKSAHYLQYQAI